MVTSALICLLLASASPPAAAPKKWNQLHSPAATASSYLQNNWNRYSENYHPSYAFDGNPKTGWVEGAEGNGDGSWIEWPVSSLANARAFKVRIRAGYHKSKNLFDANAAPKTVRIEIRDGGNNVVASSQATLPRKMDWQEIEVPMPPDRNVESLRLIVVDAHDGKSYKDTVVSDLETFVDSDVPYRRDVEEGKHKAVLGWVQERKKEAAYFAKLPKTYPFAATHFVEKPPVVVEEPGWSENEEVVKGFVRLPEQLTTGKLSAAMNKGLSSAFRAKIKEAQVMAPEPVKATEKLVAPELTRKMVLPDGVYFDGFTALKWVAGFLDPTTVTYSEADAAKANVDLRKSLASDELRWVKKWNLSNVRVEWADASKQRPRRMRFREVNVIEERGVTQSQTEYLVSFDDAGLPREILTEEKGSFGQLAYGWLRLSPNAEGRVQKIEVETVRFYREFEEDPGSNTVTVRESNAQVEYAKAP